MTPTPGFSEIITRTVEKLSTAAEINEITSIVADAARLLARADGTTFVLRDEDKCYYADENAISPLWKGKRFPMEACISGWSMLHGEVVCIPDIYQDDRIPHDAYRPTFVKSLCMVPIRASSPIGAIGNYWAQEFHPDPETVYQLQILANCAAVAVENWELRFLIGKKNDQHRADVERNSEVESALHSLVHDLRNPVCSLIVFGDLLKKHSPNQLDARCTSYLNSINRIAVNLNQTIGQLLALYRITRHAVRKQPTDLSIIGTEILEQICTQDPDRILDFVVDSEMVAPADPILIRLVVENLLSNAFKFTKRKAETRIHFGRKPAENEVVEFFVRDNGVGFDPAQAHRLFKPLSRLHDDSEFPGTGFGLASVARIVHAHGGKIRAESTPNEGACFLFSLPREVERIGHA